MDENVTKPAIQSKGVWVNIVSASIIPPIVGILKHYGVDIPSDVMAYGITLLGGVNILIRLVTKKPISSQ